MIRVQNLKKSFGRITAVNGISFTVAKGEVLGFLGPNGAGKSTTMRILTGFIPPSAGEVSIAGFNMLDNPIPAKRLIGYLPENAPSYVEMTVLGFLGFAAELRGFRGEAKKRAVDRADRDVFSRTGRASDHRDAVERLPTPHLFRAGNHPRSRSLDYGRTDGRPRSQSKT